MKRLDTEDQKRGGAEEAEDKEHHKETDEENIDMIEKEKDNQQDQD